VGTYQVADVHIGDGVTIDLIGIVEGIAKGDEGGKQAIERPETTQPVFRKIQLRRSVRHAGEALL
jgi:hypothetical protein